MAGNGDVILDAGARAAIEAGKALVFVGPPAGWALTPLFAALPMPKTAGPRLVVLAPDIPDALDVAHALRRLPAFEPIHVSTAVSRTARLLGQDAIRTLVTTSRDALRLLELSRLALDRVSTIVLLWPEGWLPGDGEVIDALLAEAPAAQRLIATSDPESLKDVLERHARRAPLAVASRVPERPATAARYVVTDAERRAGVARAVVDALDPASTLLWEPAAEDRYGRWVEFSEDPTIEIGGEVPAARRFDLALAVDLPSPETLTALSLAASEVVVLARASQVPYLLRIARPLRNFRLSGPVDQARERAHALRQTVRDRIAHGDVSAELLALSPLFDEYDPALVAAALVRGAGAPAATGAAIPAWVRLHVNLGRRDHLRPSDLVGALLNGVGLAKTHVGKIDIRDHHSTVEVRADDAERAVRGLGQLMVRGRSLSARIAP